MMKEDPVSIKAFILEQVVSLVADCDCIKRLRLWKKTYLVDPPTSGFSANVPTSDG